MNGLDAAAAALVTPATNPGANGCGPSQPVIPRTGCDRLRFDTSLRLRPRHTRPDEPAAYDVDLRVAQDGDAQGRSAPTLRRAVVTLPAGVGIAPPSAIGLEGCADVRRQDDDERADAARVAEPFRDVVVDLPPGFYGDPTAYPTCAPELINSNPVRCPASSQVGFVWIQIGSDPMFVVPDQIYNLEPRPDEVAAFGFRIFTVPTLMRIGVRTGGDHGLRVTVRNVNSTYPLFATRITLWGVPAHPAHDFERWDPALMSFGATATTPLRPFLTAPARCDGPLAVTARMRGWQRPDRWVTVSDTIDVSWSPGPVVLLTAKATVKSA